MLITGCSSGLGRYVAQAVLARGWNAVVTARDPRALSDIVRNYPETALALSLDVTDGEQIRAVVRRAETPFGRVDVLVNNAGYGYRAALEEAEDAEVRAIFETNVFALVAMTRAVLPTMRAMGAGTIVSISSVSGRESQAGSGFYSTTRFAVGALSDALHKEVGPLGIHVIVIEPGPTRTDFAGRSLRLSKVQIGDYAAAAGLRQKEIDQSDGRQPGDPRRVAEVIIMTVEAETHLSISCSDDELLTGCG